jgi:hypothetical protein
MTISSQTVAVGASPDTRTDVAPIGEADLQDAIRRLKRQISVVEGGSDSAVAVGPLRKAEAQNAKNSASATAAAAATAVTANAATGDDKTFKTPPPPLQQPPPPQPPPSMTRKRSHRPRHRSSSRRL